nr:unnamed protein product [Callosobruchus chinensis]
MRLSFALSIPTKKAETLAGRVLREDPIVLKRMQLYWSKWRRTHQFHYV